MINKATTSDIEEIVDLALLLWPNHVREELREEFLAALNSKECAIFLAEENQTKIGFAQTQLRHDYVEGTGSSPVGYLEGIFVREEYRRQGISKELLGYCENWSKEQGCTEFASDCEITNEESFVFHMNVGFTEANRIICFAKKL